MNPRDAFLDRHHQLVSDFATLGKKVPVELVPGLVRAGFTVWSFGYDADEGYGFTTIDRDDLEDWDNDDAEATWGPFRLDNDF